MRAYTRCMVFNGEKRINCRIMVNLLPWKARAVSSWPWGGEADRADRLLSGVIITLQESIKWFWWWSLVKRELPTSVAASGTTAISIKDVDSISSSPLAGNLPIVCFDILKSTNANEWIGRFAAARWNVSCCAFSTHVWSTHRFELLHSAASDRPKGSRPCAAVGCNQARPNCVSLH